MLNYEKLMSENPTVYGKMVNSKGQEIVFVEHPTKGDEAEVICVCHELKLASYSGFYETDDMEAEHKEYEPSFVDGKFVIGEYFEETPKEIIRLVDKETDRIISYKVEGDAVVGINFNQGVDDLTVYAFKPNEEILNYFNKIHGRVEDKNNDSLNESLKSAVEIYCMLNIY